MTPDIYLATVGCVQKVPPVCTQVLSVKPQGNEGENPSLYQ